MANEKIPRGEVNSRIGSWIKRHPEGFVVDWDDPPRADQFLEAQLLDKAKYQDAGKPKHKKERIWVLEYKWLNEEFYQERYSSWRRELYPFNPDWQKKAWNFKFYSLRSAIDSLVNGTKKGHAWVKTDMVGRSWRIRNIKTGEIYEYDDQGER